MGNGHWATGNGHWALGIKEVRMRECVNKYDSFHAPCPMPHALCPMPHALCPMPLTNHVLPQSGSDS
ncbi:hypothetical protein [[Scytonema hofmanni] UTEX B 1581]|uniref:hypothetical protein n=1 Tax=[Scytonema hofmanni] UTEX B 1581 TaxID=379535 RepID=UPI00163F2B0C|nr:hypothetical protein [[Scytonema hofmanni] UTEX B 1581]